MKREDTIDFYFRKIWHNISRIYNSEAAHHGITMSAGFALISIEKEGTPSTHLGPRMGMEPRSLTRMLKTLEDKGWVEKRKDALDKRVVRIFLTELGKEKRKVATEAVFKFNESVQSHFSPEELKTFFAISQKLDGILEDNNIFNDETHN